MKNHMLSKLKKLLRSFPENDRFRCQDLEIKLDSLVAYRPVGIQIPEKTCMDNFNTFFRMYNNKDYFDFPTRTKHLELFLFVISLNNMHEKFSVHAYRLLEIQYLNKKVFPVAKLIYIATRANNPRIRVLALLLLKDKNIFKNSVEDYMNKKVESIKSLRIRTLALLLIKNKHIFKNLAEDCTDKKVKSIKKSTDDRRENIKTLFSLLVEGKVNGKELTMDSYSKGIDKLRKLCIGYKCHETLLLIISLKAKDKKIFTYVLNRLYAILSVKDSVMKMKESK